MLGTGLHQLNTNCRYSKLATDAGGIYDDDDNDDDDDGDDRDTGAIQIGSQRNGAVSAGDIDGVLASNPANSIKCVTPPDTRSPKGGVAVVWTPPERPLTEAAAANWLEEQTGDALGSRGELLFRELRSRRRSAAHERLRRCALMRSGPQFSGGFAPRPPATTSFFIHFFA